MAQVDTDPEMTMDEEVGRLSSRGVQAVVVGLVLVAFFMNIAEAFNLQAMFSLQLINTSYIYAMTGLFLSLVFLCFPAVQRDRARIRFYDWVLWALSLAAAGYFAWNGQRIIQEGWDISAPTLGTAASLVFCLLSLEAVRRTGSFVLCLICLFFFAFPLYADKMPGFLWGPASSFGELFRQHALGTESIIGAPVRVVISTLFGFLVFGSALVITGGGEFFMTFASALLGRSRGGPAKVAIISSGFFGSLSGSVISNVVTTGRMTIPTMKRVGYPSTYAAAVEACASTGGAMMPPVMGAVAFIMAEYLNLPYSTVMIAAIVPAVLYYFALLLQVDNFAAKKGLRGQDAAEIPDLMETLRGGWYFIFSLVLLVVILLVSGNEARAPYYATAVLIACGIFRKTNPFRLSSLVALIIDSGRSITAIVGLLVGIGMIVGSLSYTGVGGAFSRELLHFAGHSVALILVLGAVTSFILGMGMTASACYIFLATVLAPAMTGMGLDPIASHLFILYWGMLSFITPPVALAALAAAGISKSAPFRTGFLSMRLGLVNFIQPFLFVLSPTLTLNGPLLDILHDVTATALAIWLMTSAFEGWLYGVGRLGRGSRATALVSAALLFFPGLLYDVVGIAMLAGLYISQSVLKRPAGPQVRASTERKETA